jgi:hypothetical protein
VPTANVRSVVRATKKGLQGGMGSQEHRRPHRPPRPRRHGSVPNLTILERAVNDQPGLVVQQDGVTVAVIAFDVVVERIKHIWAVRNPEKLRPWTTG